MAELPKFEYIQFENLEPHVAWLTLNRPEKLNSFDAAMGERFGAALTHIQADPDIGLLNVVGARMPIGEP